MSRLATLNQKPDSDFNLPARRLIIQIPVRIVMIRIQRNHPVPQRSPRKKSQIKKNTNRKESHGVIQGQ
jgi:hypothetical protein